MGARRKSSQQLEQLSKHVELLRHEKQIALVLNMMATRIQRAWRGYFQRKRPPSHRDRRPISTHSEFSQKTEEGFNNRKYIQGGSYTKLYNQPKLDSRQESVNRLSLERLPEPIQQKDQLQQSFHTPHRHSISIEIERELEAQRRCIQLVSNTISVQVKPMPVKSNRYEDVFVKTPRCRFIEMVDKCQTLLQKQKMAKILSIQNRYTGNQLTQRTYLKLQGEVESSYRREKRQFVKKRNAFKSSWHEVHRLLKAQNKDKQFEEDSLSCMDRSWSRDEKFKQHNEIEQVLNDLVNSSDKQAEWPRHHAQFVSPLNLTLENTPPPKEHEGKTQSKLYPPPPKQNPIVIEESSSPSQELTHRLSADAFKKVQALPPALSKEARIAKIISQKQLNKLSIDVTSYSTELLDRLVEQFVREVITKYFVVTSLKMLKSRRRPKKLPYKIDTSIDAVNNWLLEIAHFVLDYHKDELQHNLLRPNILTPKQFLRGGAIHPFQCISLEIFSEFEYYYVKRVKESMKLDKKHEEEFTTMINVHDLCMYNSLNEAVSLEMGITKQENYAPWFSRNGVVKLPTKETSKGLLERAINVVSQWAEASLGQTQHRPSTNQQEIYAVLDVLEIPLSSRQYETKLCLFIVAEVEKWLLSELFHQLNFI